MTQTLPQQARAMAERLRDVAKDESYDDPDLARVIAEAAALLVSMAEAMEWRPIETASPAVEVPETSFRRPQYVLVGHFKNGYVFVGYRYQPNYPDDPEWCDESGEFIEPQPTHWMPLPAPPASDEGEKG
jgi:hypothetical protein